MYVCFGMFKNIHIIRSFMHTKPYSRSKNPKPPNPRARWSLWGRKIRAHSATRRGPAYGLPKLLLFITKFLLVCVMNKYMWITSDMSSSRSSSPGRRPYLGLTIVFLRFRAWQLRGMRWLLPFHVRKIIPKMCDHFHRNTVQARAADYHNFSKFCILSWENLLPWTCN